MGKIRLNKKDIEEINKISQVEFNKSTGKIKVDDLSKKKYKNIKTEIKRLEQRFDLNLNKYSERLERDFNNLKKEVSILNREPQKIIEKDFTELKYQSFKLNQIEEMVRKLNPSRYSKDYKSNTFEMQALSQMENIDIANIELKYWQDLTGLDVEEIEEYLYPTSSEEDSWYEQYTALVDSGIDEEDARIITNDYHEEYKPNKINGKTIYNMEDLIKHFVPPNKRAKSKRFLSDVTQIRLLNLGE